MYIIYQSITSGDPGTRLHAAPPYELPLYELLITYNIVCNVIRNTLVGDREAYGNFAAFTHMNGGEEDALLKSKNDDGEERDSADYSSVRDRR